MKIVLRILVCFLVLFMLVGCSSILEPTKPEDSLLIGQLALRSEGWGDFMNASVNGTIKGAISMQIQNSDTGETYATSTSSDGYFYKLNPSSGNYVIKKLAYQNSSSQGWLTLTWEPNLKLNYIEVEPGKVINLGVLTWVATKYDEKTRISTLTQVYEPEFLQEQFAEKFPKSLWLEREWVSINPFAKK